MKRLRLVTAMLHGLLLVTGSVFAQELPNPALTASTRAMFEAARRAVHETQFEKASDLLGELLDAEPALALAHAYAAVTDRLLFRDPAEQIDLALSLVADRPKGEQQMTEALVKFAEGDLDASQDVLIDFFKDYPDDPWAAHLLGLVLNDSGRSAEAVDVLRELIRSHPDFDPAWNHLGYAFMETGDMDRARAAFDMFAEFYPRNPSVYDSMAELFARKGETDSSIEYLLKAVQLEPRMAFAWMHMGDILVAGGSQEEARAAYQKAIDASALYGDEFRELVENKIAELGGTESDSG